MFAQRHELMLAVITISKKYDMTISGQRVGGGFLPDHIIAHMLNDLDSRLDTLQAEKEKLREELDGFKSKNGEL